jgi:hypothetical protein
VRIKTRFGMRRRKVIEQSVPARLSHLPQYANGMRPMRFIEGFAPKS